MGSRRRGAARLGIIVAAVAAAMLVLAPAVLGGLGVGGSTPIPLGGLERLYYGHPHGQPDKLRAVIRADRKRVARCAMVLATGRSAGTCPSPKAYRAGRNRKVLTSARRLTAARGIPGIKRQTATPDQIGQWSAPFRIPQLAVHAVNLPTGKVLWFAYPDSTWNTNEASAWLWDPVSGTTKRVDPPVNPATGRPFNIWCAGQAMLPDGRVVVAGGNLQYSTSPIALSGWKGLSVLLTFNPWNETWTRQPDMRHGRWYPTVMTMPDGRAVIVSGYDEVGNNDINTDVEVFTPSANLNGVGTVENKPTAARSSSLYPHMFWTPQGKALMVGPDRQAALLDTATWTWQDLPAIPTSRLWGSAVLVPGGTAGSSKVMLIGGVDLPGTISASASTATIDLGNLAAGWTAGPAMLHPRAHLNTVILPDGGLLSVGGGIGQDAIGSLYSGPVYESEILPAGGTAWTAAATQADERTYHSTALLLPDGRVVSAGDDRPGAQYTDTAEIYSPPYLFKGARPALSWAPAAVPYATAFQVATPDAATVTKAVLIQTGAVTHANDMSQRSIAVAFTRTGSTLTLTSPPGVNAAPPGYYMLFLLNAQGVPSVSRMVQLSTTAPAPPAPPANLSPDAAFTYAPAAPKAGDLVTFTDGSTDPDGTIAGRAWDLNGDGLFDDATGPTAGRTFAAAGTYTVSEKVTDNGGAATTTSRVVTVAPATRPTIIPAGNLTANASFETGTAGWDQYGATLERLPDAAAPDGASVMRVTRSATGGTVFTMDDSPDTVLTSVLGRTYQATAYVRAGNAQSVGRTATIRVREQSAAGDLLGEYAGSVTLTAAFQKVEAFTTTRTSGAHVDVYIGVIDAVPGDAFDADAVSLVATGGGAGYNQPPAPSFTTAPAAPVTGQTVTFTDTSTDPDGTIAWGAWDLNGDGAFDEGTGATATRAFAAPGTYVVRRLVSDTQGASAVAIRTVTVTAPVIPAGNLTTNPSFETGVAGWGTYNATVARVTGTGLPDGTAFGRLTATGAGFFALDDNPDTVATATLGSAYNATAYLRAGNAAATGKRAVLRIREMSPAGEVVSEWTGSVVLTTAFQPVSALATTRVAGDRLEVYTGIINSAVGDVLDIDGVSMVATAGGAGYDKAPAPSFTVAPAAPVSGSAVTFTDTSTDADGTIAGRAWDLDGDRAFDDGTGATVQKTFATAGTYTVREQVTDNLGATSVAVRTVVVTAGVIPAGNLTANPSFESGVAGWGTYNATVARLTGTGLPDGTAFGRLTGTATGFFALDDDPDSVATATLASTYGATAHLRAGNASATGRTAVLRIREMSPAGEVVSEWTGSIVLTTAFQPVSAFATTRVAGDRLEVYLGVINPAVGDVLDADAISMVATAGGAGYDKAPAPSFTVAPAAPVAGSPVTFTDTSTDADGTIAGRAWDLDGDRAFDDGTGATIQKTFAAAGTYTVREQVTDNLGTTSVAVRTVVVAAPAIPAGNLTTNPSFETNTTGWAGTTATLARTVVAGTPAGTAAVKVTRSSGTAYGLDDSPNSVLSAAAAGSTYTAAAWVRSAVTASNGKTVTIQIRERNAAGTVVKTTTTTATLNATTFTKISVTASVTTAGDSLDVFVQQTGAASGHAFYADAVSIVKN